MKANVTSIARAALCAITLSLAAAPASGQTGTLAAAPASAQPAAGSSGGARSPALAATVEQVQYRGREGFEGRRYGGDRRYGYRRGNNFGRNAAIGLGAAIIGGIVLSEAARAEHRSSHASDWDRCTQTYRSFEPDTGMYTGYDGVRRTCPFLN